MRILNVIILSSLIVFCLITNYQVASADAVIVVNTSLDDNGKNLAKCSLREAVISANENRAFGGCASGSTGLDIIRLPAIDRPYSLTIVNPNQALDENKSYTGDLDILGSVQFLGDGYRSTEISGANAKTRVFHILTSATVLFQNLTITGGDFVDKGGGVYVAKGNVTFLYVHISGNHAAKAGGGLVVNTGAVAWMEYSEISNNTSEGAAGILNEGNLTISKSLILQNNAQISTGGVTCNSLQDTEKTVIINSTITQNSAKEGFGAGISVASDSTLVSINSTISDNLGIGLDVFSQGRGSIKNTIIARQKKGGDVPPNCRMPADHQFLSYGHNLTTDDTCDFGPNDIQASLPDLGMADGLSDNGGPTQTYALSEGSPAVDAGDNQGCDKRDQRKFFRPAQGKSEGGSLTCDIGAFELGGSVGHTIMIPYMRK